MKRSLFIVGLAALACLAAGSAKFVFGQMGSSGVVLPVPVAPPTQEDVYQLVQPPALPPLNAGHLTPVTGPGLPGAMVPAVPMKMAQQQPNSPRLPEGTGPSLTMPQRTPQSGPVLAPPNTVTPGKTTPGERVLPASFSQVNAELQAEAPDAIANADNPTGRQEPAVSLEWVGPTTARLNQPTTFQIIAKNICNTPVQHVVVHYRIPMGVRIAGAEPPAANEGNSLTWDLGNLQPGQDKRIDLQILPESKIAVSCQASVTFTGLSTIKVQVCEPKLTLKASAPEHTVQGDVATVALTVTNPGDGLADHVKIKAVLPEGLEHARGKMFELDLGCLAPGESRTAQLVCLAKLPGAQVVDCVALADGGLAAQDVAKVDVVFPRLELLVTGPRLRYLERPAHYALKVTNPGSAPASNVNVVEQLPQGFKFQSASNGGRQDFASRTVSWFVGDLAPGESREVTLEAIATNIGDHQLKALATAARGLKTECELVTRVEGLSALLMELVDTDDPIEVGAETSYEIRVTNTGSKTETNLELVCTVPDKMDFRGAKCAAGCRYRVEGKDVIFEPLPRLAPRADVLYRVVVRGLAPGDMRFRARIRADGLSEPVLREESTKVYGDEAIPR